MEGATPNEHISKASGNQHICSPRGPLAQEGNDDDAAIDTVQ